MTKEEIIEYVINSPENTNPNVFADMLNSLDNGNSSNNDFTTAKVTVTVEGSCSCYIPITNSDSSTYYINNSGEYNVILYKGKAIISPSGDISNLNGNIEALSQYEYIITGDCSFTITGGEAEK